MAFDDAVVLFLLPLFVILLRALVYPYNRTKLILLVETFVVFVTGFALVIFLQLFFGVILLAVGAVLAYTFSGRSRKSSRHF
jgi:hypothetical protein